MINKSLSIIIVLFVSSLSAAGGFDLAKSAGKGNWEFSLTWNPLNIFPQGQSYIIGSYGINNDVDLHFYYSQNNDFGDNYYGGFFYQFIRNDKINISTAIGVRGYLNNSVKHFFLPQLFFSTQLSEKILIGGSAVDIRNISNFERISDKPAVDSYITYNFINTNKIELGISIGAFHPSLWTPSNGNWHPTYSLQIKILN